MSNILKFFVKRVFFLYVVLLIVCFFNKDQRIPMIAILTLSVFFSILRFAMLEGSLKLLGSKGSRKLAIIVSIMLYLFWLVIVGGLVAIALKIGIYTFFAALVGSLSTEAIIMINSITEALGITKNQFGQKVK